MRKLDRRGFLGLTGAAGVGAAWALSGFSEAKAWAAPAFPADPFRLGVASGDPQPNGVVLWTRLAPDPLLEDGTAGMPDLTLPVRWEVAEDETFRRVVARGEERATPDLGHSVHAEVTTLRPDREYFYRFRAGREISPVGRTKTAPVLDARKARLDFAFVSCQSYLAGFYNAYEHLAQEDVDVVVHLGDYIYENANQGTIGRGHLPAAEVFSLADYRVRHAQYKTDAHLRATHAAFPWIVTWDDHEVENNYADDMPQNPAEQPAFLRRRAAAYQAYYEHLPLRRTSLPHGPDLRLFRRVQYGQLATFHVIDSRQYRSDQACEGTTSPCPETYDPARTMLGEEQERWLSDGLADSTTTWQILANQSVVSEADRDPGPGKQLGADNWNGYQAARQRLLESVVERDVDNFVVITGDAHCSMAGDLKLDFDDPDSTTAGAEFLGTSITTGGDGAAMDQRGREWLAANPNMKYYNGQRGYVRCTVRADELRSNYRVLPSVTTEGAPISTHASLVVEAGRPGVQVDASTT